jgi:holo-[acyl-carrier protein] synthase
MLCLSRQDRVKFVAKRFAAKEAFAKACGTGLRAPILLSNISVENDDLGKPYFVFAPPLQNWLDAKGIVKYHLSLSDERSLSSAFVILESE